MSRVQLRAIWDPKCACPAWLFHDKLCPLVSALRPLHDAVENNHVEVVRLLLACGADPTLTSCSGRGPIDMTSSVAMETFFEGRREMSTCLLSKSGFTFVRVGLA